jgi:hypothetical protein
MTRAYWEITQEFMPFGAKGMCGSAEPLYTPCPLQPSFAVSVCVYSNDLEPFSQHIEDLIANAQC